MDWRHRAACTGIDPELFQPTGPGGPALVQIAEAKAVCGRCPVRQQCLDYALSYLPYGVAGGLTATERRDLRAAGKTCARPVEPEHTVEVVGMTRAELRAAGFAALRAGHDVDSVAWACKVSPRTVERWAKAIRDEADTWMPAATRTG